MRKQVGIIFLLHLSPPIRGLKVVYWILGLHSSLIQEDRRSCRVLLGQHKIQCSIQYRFLTCSLLSMYDPLQTCFVSAASQIFRPYYGQQLNEIRVGYDNTVVKNLLENITQENQKVSGARRWHQHTTCYSTTDGRLAVVALSICCCVCNIGTWELWAKIRATGERSSACSWRVVGETTVASSSAQHCYCESPKKCALNACVGGGSCKCQTQPQQATPC